MNQPNRPDQPDGRTRVVRLDKRGTRRGVDDVIDRLRTPDGWRWWESAVRTFVPEPATDSATLAGLDRAPLEQLRSAKERAKGAFSGPGHGDERAGAIACYYAVIAAALVHHGELITRQKRAPLNEAFLDLGASTPEPWSGLFKRAAGS